MNPVKWLQEFVFSTTNARFIGVNLEAPRAQLESAAGYSMLSKKPWYVIIYVIIYYVRKDIETTKDFSRMYRGEGISPGVISAKAARRIGRMI
ncbi:hypothetical protein IFR04_010762 [Cadophora malorum]|uniref:Uncharacterized protein n=1 Tax=Cadophora malorum TaxID=108018 RepID=A0A8H7T6N5_9HELO|nr:hypothetical protein IFR04_010762 [Cadophora malorum]